MRSSALSSGNSGTAKGERHERQREGQGHDRAGERQGQGGRGRGVGNERLTAEGRAEQATGDARQAKEKLKDAAKD